MAVLLISSKAEQKHFYAYYLISISNFNSHTLPDTAFEESPFGCAVFSKLSLMQLFAFFCTYCCIVAVNFITFLGIKILVITTKYAVT